MHAVRSALRVQVAALAASALAACGEDVAPIQLGGEGEGERSAAEGEGEAGGEGEGEDVVVGDCPAVAGASFGPAIPLVVPRSRHAAALLDDGRVMLTGGEDNGFGQITDVEIIDVDAGTSEAGPPLNEARYTHAAVTLKNGNVVVAGGFGVELHKTSIEMFDGTAWTVIGDLDQARAGLSGALVGDVAVFFGGNNGEAIPRTVVSVDEAGVVSVVAGVDIGANRQLSAIAQRTDGSVVVAGGFFTTAIDTAVAFDLDGTRPLPALPGARRQATGGRIGSGAGERVVVVGGLASSILDEIVTLPSVGDGAAWSVTGHLATPRFSPETVTLGGCLVVCGGLGGAPAELIDLDSCEGVDEDGVALPMAATLPAATFSFSFTALDEGRALFAGGSLEGSHVGEARVLTAAD